MATTRNSRDHTRRRAKHVTRSGAAVRERVRRLSVSAFRDRELSIQDVPKLVRDVLAGAMEGIDESIPKSKRNVLREVFDGLRDGVGVVASAGSSVAKDVRSRSRTVTGRSMPHAARRIREANDDFLGAVKSFASTTSGQVRQELESLVKQAQRTGPKVAASARQVTRAADGRLVELSAETARAGVRAARRAAGALAMGAGGLLEGLAEAVSPKQPKRAARSRISSGRRTGKKTVKRTSREKN